jgi:hypothetical protein
MLVKGLQLLVIVSIFNPFCCCLAGVFSFTGLDAWGTRDAVSDYCTSATGEHSAPADQPSSPFERGDCPHQSYKAHQQVTPKEIKADPLSPVYVPLLIAAVRDFAANTAFTARPLAPMLPSTAVKPASPTSLTRLYCVYRI